TVIPSGAENGAAGEAATWTGWPEAERTGSERIKSRSATEGQFRGVPRLRFASLGMTANRTLAILFSLAFGLATVAYAQPDADFEKANQEYAQGHFAEAISGYETLVRAAQWSATLFYDLGNAYFRTGDFGRAILNYERALALERHHPEATANLQIARDEAHALEIQPSSLERYLQFASLNQYSIAAATAFWLAIFAMFALIFKQRRSARVIAVSICCLLVLAVAVYAIFTIERGSKGQALAVVTGKDVQARLATADTANSVLALPAGSEIRILSTRGDWIYATLP